MGTTCPECGCSYEAEIPSNVEWHNKIHDEHLSGPPIQLSDCTYFVTPDSSSELREAAESAARVGNREARYDFPAYCGYSSEDDHDSDLIPITCSDAMPIRVGAKRRWRSYGA